ncbi:ERI1 exoribonuclease 2 isoform X1 [Hypanus sabinus]|uniref:ERI1 exoribonuclease 2 isoform X1 n=1 Tax=Hypanus sabinus TaxID=79690 RepID=UPI0028C4161E|nr:ERI1 exoribonuclease 2 isoform X1 [Hypanus sabinus]
MTTKQLAEQLGLIRRRSSVSVKGNEKPKLNQYFSYLIIIDFESTCWKNGKSHYHPEIIEFPAVLLNTSSGEIEVEFHTYVQPQEHPILSAFCTDLTGIKQCQVEAGVPLAICLSQFSRWIQKLQQEKNIDFVKGGPQLCTPDSKTCTFVTWSDWDLGVCLHYECKRKQLRKPSVLNSWIDLRATYKLFYNRKPKGLNGALQDLGIVFSGREHSGLDDARNTARLAWRMICDGCTMKITKSLDRVAPMRNLIARLPTVNPVPGGKTSQATPFSEDPDNGRRVSLFPENDTLNKRTAEIKHVVAHHERKVTINQHKPVLPTLTKTGRQHMGTIDCRNGNNGNAHYQNLISPRTLINGLSTSIDHSKEQKLQVNVKNIAMSAEETKPNGSVCNLLLVSTTVDSVTSTSNLNVSCSESGSPWEYWEDSAMLPLSGNDQSIGYRDEGEDGKELGLVEGEYITEDCSVLDSPQSRKDYALTEDKKHQEEVQRNLQTIYNVAEVMRQAKDQPIFKVPKVNVSSVLSSHFNVSTESSATSLLSFRSNNHLPVGIKRKEMQSSPFKAPISKKQSFTIYSDKNSSPNCSLPAVVKTDSRVIPSAYHSYPAQCKLIGKKITPPLCGCGRRAKRLTVSKAGPNHGKAFYSCAMGKRNPDNSKGCGYFKWEWALKKEKASSVSFANNFSAGSSGAFPSSQRKHLGLRFSFRN